MKSQRKLTAEVLVKYHSENIIWLIFVKKNLQDV